MTALRVFLGLVPWQAWAVAGFLAFSGVAYLKIDSAAYERGRAFERDAARVAAGKRIVEMEKTNEAFRSLPALERCRAFLRDSGLPLDHCGN